MVVGQIWPLSWNNLSSTLPLLSSHFKVLPTPQFQIYTPGLSHQIWHNWGGGRGSIRVWSIYVLFTLGTMPHEEIYEGPWRLHRAPVNFHKQNEGKLKIFSVFSLNLMTNVWDLTALYTNHFSVYKSLQFYRKSILYFKNLFIF